MQIAQKNFYKKLLGKVGEKKAAEHLKKQGYKILELNFKTHLGEIDIVAKDGDYTVFVEVKTRADDAFGYPVEAVNAKKQDKIIKVSMEYMMRKANLDMPMRYDVVEINDGQINHIKDAFRG